MVEKHNKDPSATFTMHAYPQFVGLSEEEFAASHLNNIQKWGPTEDSTAGRVISPSEAVKVKYGVGKVGAQYFDVDHRARMGTPVHDQGKCGNCYAIAVIDSVDMRARGQSKGWPLLSDQELTDCSNGIFPNQGCNGGNIYVSNDFLIRRGVHAASLYPAYSFANGYAGGCVNNFAPSLRLYRISGRVQTTYGNCYDLAVTVQNGRPTVVALTGGAPLFRFYRSGVLKDCGTYNVLDHAVVLVGVTLNAGRGNYWIVKNSWGIFWGENGYIRIDNTGSSCLLCYFGVYPLL